MCDSRNAANRRAAALIRGLAEAIAAATSDGDLEVARVAHEALGKLIAAPGAAYKLVDLAERRNRVTRKGGRPTRAERQLENWLRR